MSKRLLRDESGFTLLETLIAVAIMLVAFASILMVESSSLQTTVKAKRANIVQMLAKQKMVESELKVEGKSFEEVKEEESGTFEAPYQDYSWKVSVKELKFPTLPLGSLTGPGEEQGGGESQNQMAETLAKLMAKYLSEAIRELNVTISWKVGPGQQSYSVSTYWVDLNHEFPLSE